MQNAETILGVIHDRGQRGLKLERLYRQLYNQELYLRAYANLYANDGSLTPGVADDTVDGMSLQKISQLIEELRYERFRWTPVRRTYITKKDGQSKRPLGLPTWTDKLLQEVIRMLLQAYYEPQFSDSSHGFRPNRGCHTALQEIKHTHRGTKWFIEGDIAACFDSFDHTILLDNLREDIDDGRFIRLIKYLLKAGYMENWRWYGTYSGTPQGGVLSPLLANIYLDRLDTFVEETLIPEYHHGRWRRRNSEYRRYYHQKQQAKKRGDWEAYKANDKKMRQLPSKDPNDPDYRRLKFVRYADDFLLSFAGPKSEAEEIKQRLATFLRDELKLELSQTKTLVSHASTEPARFLGYDIQVQYSNSWRDSQGHRNANGEIALKLPPEVLQEYCARYMRNGKPIHRAARIVHSDYDIIVQYQTEYRGYVQYYALAQNLYKMNKLRWVMKTSLLKTLANKYKSTVKKMAKRYSVDIETEHGPMKVLRVVVERDGKPPLIAEFGGIPLRTRKRDTRIRDKVYRIYFGRCELIDRLLADECELCGSRQNVEVHHIRKLADLKKEGRKEKPLWVRRMAAIRRKTLVVCSICHQAIHNGETRAVWNDKLESR